MSFLLNKEINRICLPGEKILIYFSFLGNISYFLVIFCSFIIPLTDDSFSLELFDLVLLLIVNRHTFSRLLMPTDRGISGHIKVSWDNHTNFLSCFSCSIVPDILSAWFLKPGLQLYGI